MSKCSLKEVEHGQSIFMECETHSTMQSKESINDGCCTFSKIPDHKKTDTAGGRKIYFRGLLDIALKAVTTLNAIPYEHKHFLVLKTEGTYVEIALCNHHIIYSTSPNRDFLHVYDEKR